MKLTPAKHKFQSPTEDETDTDEDRPVRFVPDGYNSWRVVWADEAKR